MSRLPDTDRPHAVNPDPRLRAVAADLEYFRAKRLEPRVLHLVRRGVISLNDLIRAGRNAAGDRTSRAGAADIEQRLRILEDRLDGFVAASRRSRWLPAPLRWSSRTSGASAATTTRS